MRFNNSSMALLDIPDLPERAFIRKAGGGIIPQGGGGGQQAPTNTTNTTNTSNIPPYAQPYVENMLGATQAQLFKTTGATNPDGTPTIDPNTGQQVQNITGFNPYQAYGSTDANGNPVSATQAAQSAVAGFQPLQTQAQQGVAQLQTPDQYNQAMGFTNQGIGGLFGTAGQAGQYGQAGYNAGMSYGQQAQNGPDGQPSSTVQNYMNPYLQATLQPSMQLLNQQYGMQQAANQGHQTQAGAFGGSRGTLENSLNQQNQMLAQNQLVGNAYNQAYNTANQNMQAAAGLGMQGAQAGLAGLGAQQSGINAGLAGANQLANLGQQQLGTQQNILNMQNQYGAQQQQYNQNVINQAMQNYANAQQYPIMELGTMSNMLRGLPMQATTTNQYQATPSLLSQGIGAAGVGATLNALTKGSKKGGLQKNTTGINSYDVGGAIRADLENMPTDALQDELKKTQSDIMKSDIQQILAQRAMVPQSNSGGIMAYADGDKVVAPGGANEGNVGEAEAAANVGNGINTVAPEFKALPPQQQNQKLVQAGISQVADPSMKNLFMGQMNEAMRKANEPTEDIVARNQAAYDKLVGPDNSLAEMMKEKANAKEEGERQRQLRLGQIFARWGSTPGPTLVAGLNAFANVIPSVIADSDKQAEIMQRINNSIMQIHKADRLEKIGRFKEAEAEKKQAGIDVEKLNNEVVRWNVSEKRSAEQLERERMKETQETKEKALDRASRIQEARIHASGASAGQEYGYKTHLLSTLNGTENALLTGSKNLELLKKPGSEYWTAKQMLNNPDLTQADKEKYQQTVSDVDSKADELESLKASRHAIRSELKKYGLDMGTTKADAATAETSAPVGLPEGAKLVGTSGGKNVYELPNGKRIIEK